MSQPTRPSETPFQTQAYSSFPLLKKNSSVVYEDVSQYDILLFMHSQRGLAYDPPDVTQHAGYSDAELFSGNCIPITRTKDLLGVNNIFIVDQRMIVFTIDELELHPWIHQTKNALRIMAGGDMRLGKGYGWIRLYDKEYWLKDVFLYMIQKTNVGVGPEDPITGKRVSDGVMWTGMGVIDDKVVHQTIWDAPG